MRLLILLLLFAIPASAQSQQGKATITNTYRYFEVKDGLPQMQVWSLTEDAHGFIWVSTKDGMARWDGTDFHTWNSRTPGFGHVHARELIQVGADEYMAVTGNTARWVKGNRFAKVMLPDSLTSIESIFKLNDSEVIFSNCEFNNIASQGTEFTHIIYNYRKRKISRAIKTKGRIYSLLNEHSFITEYKEQHLNNVSLYLYTINSELMDSLTGFNNTPFLSNKGASFQAYDCPVIKGNEYINGLIYCFYQLSAKNDRFHKRKILLRTPIEINDHPGEVELIYINDTIYYYIDTGRYVHLVKGNNNERYCRIGSANAAITDHNRNLWLGTEQGLYCFYNNSFRQYDFNFIPGGSDEIWSIARGGNGLYYIAAYKSGIYEYDDKVNSWKKMDITLENKSLDKTYAYSLNCGTLAGTRLWDGGVFLPLLNGFGIKNKNGLNVYLLLKDPETFGAITDNLRHCIYVAQYCHAYRINADYSLDTLCSAASAGLRNVMCCTIDKNGCPIFGGSGLKNNFIKYENGAVHPVMRKSSTPVSMCTDHNGNIWIAANDSFYFYDNRNMRAINIPSQSLFISVKAYDKKWLLIGTNKEFIILDIETFYKNGKIACYRYDYTNGFNAIDCSQNSMLIDDDGTVWIPTSKSTMRFNPKNLVKENKTTTPIIENIFFSGQDFNWQPDTTFYASSIERQPGWRNLQFAFIAANINGASQITYRYRLIGYNQSWSAPTTNKIAIFNNLPPGNYRFEVSCSLDGINWGPAAVSVPILLHSAFYETGIFQLALMLFFLVFITGLIILAVKVNYRKKMVAQQQHTRLLSLQFQAIRSKAIPHFSSNVFNNIDYLIERQQYEDANRYLAMLSRLYNYILLDAENASRSLANELQFVTNYLQLEKLRFKDKLQYEINIDDNTNMDIRIPNMVLHTYVENAIKHGIMSERGHGKVTINVVNEQDGIWLTVEDNGIGRAAARQYNQHSTGQGLSILSMQIELYNNSNKHKIIQQIIDLSDADNKALGTIFRIYVPAQYKFL